MAKMSKRTDNRFEIKVTVGGGKRLSVYGATEAEARRKAKELREMSAKALRTIWITGSTP